MASPKTEILNTPLDEDANSDAKSTAVSLYLLRNFENHFTIKF